MYFRILGPLQLQGADGPVAIGGPKARAVLAALLLRRGTPVTPDCLITDVWGAHPPPGALSALRAYVSRLRTHLGAGADGPRLPFGPGGYTLRVADDELDVTAVERILAEAHQSDPEHAVTLLQRALEHWRGDALAEFVDFDFARADAARLSELRLSTLEERNDAMLHLGRGAEVVAEVTMLVGRFPDRERLTIQLMHALYGTGRQADAMAAFHTLRRRLDDELGVLPSEPARSLYQRILEHDPTLVRASPGTPDNLPRRATSLVGRDAEVTNMIAALRRGPLVTVTGPGGVGKSRLALAVAAADTGRFPDGVWWCELAPLSDGGPVGYAVAAALQVQQRHGLGIDDTVVEYLRARRLLLVLDNCEHVLGNAARLADRIVSHCHGVAVLATSREPLGVQGEQVWPMRPLSMADAGVLFVDRARAQWPDFRADRQGTVAIAEICRRLDGLPLAIELAAARSRAMSVVEIARRLDDGRLLAGSPRTAEPRHQSLTAAIDWSYALLSPASRVLFGRLSVFAGGFDLAAAHGVCAEAGTTDAETLELLTGLVDRSMVMAGGEPGGSRYRILETLRAYAHGRLTETGVAMPTARRHAVYFTELAERAAHGMRGPHERAWVESTLPDHDNMRAAFERSATDADADLALRLVSALPEVAHVRVGYEAAEWAERALDLVPDGDQRFVAAVGAAARGAWNRGDFSHARRLAARAGGRNPAPGTARVAYAGDVLADIALYEGDVYVAQRHYEAEVDEARRSGDPVRLVWTLYYVAVCCAVRRAPDVGMAAARESLDVAITTGNPTALSMARYALGLVQKKSHPDAALRLFDEAAQQAASVRNFWWQGIALMEAAATRAVHGDPTRAADSFVQVLDHWDRVGDWTQQWLNLRYVVRLLVRLGCEADAVALHHCLVAAAKPSPLDGQRVSVLLDGPDGPRFQTAAALGARLSGTGAVELARTRLRAVRPVDAIRYRSLPDSADTTNRPPRGPRSAA